MIKLLIYLSIISAMVGSARIVSIDLGVIQLSIFRMAILLIFALMITNILVKNKSIRFSKHRNNKYSIIFMFSWFLYGFFSLAWVKDFFLWSKSMFFLTIGILVIIAFANHLRKTEEIIKAFRIISIMVIIHNIIGWYEIITSNYLFLAYDKIPAYARGNYPVSAFGNSNDYATFLLFSIWVLYINIINSKSKSLKLIFIISLVSSTILLISTDSRANVIALLTSAIYFVYKSLKHSKTRTTLIISLGILFSVLLIKPDMLTSIISSINSNLKFSFISESGSDYVRINLIKNGLMFLYYTFGFGVGAGNIEYWMAQRAVYNTGLVTNIHNWWLEILIGYGIPIFVFYVTFYYKLFNSFHKKFKLYKNRTDSSLSLGIMCFMIGYIIGSISSSSNMNSEWLWVFWGIAIAYQGIDMENDGARRELVNSKTI